MNVDIRYNGQDTGMQAVLLDELAVMLADNGLDCNRIATPARNKEKGDVLTALAISGLAIQSLGLLISGLTFYFSRRKSYTVTVKRGTITCTVGNLSEREVLKMLAESNQSDNVQVEISEGQ